MLNRNMKRFFLVFLLLFSGVPLMQAQEELTLQKCVDYALENNQTLLKSKLDCEIAVQSRREVLGALLPQVSGSGSIAYNFDKNTVIMPNFMNAMLPEAIRDPNADPYITIPMGLTNTANVGASLVQQILNLSLLNALNITEAAQEMAEIGMEISTDDVISQTATIFYNIQVLEYGLDQFDRSIALMDKTMEIMTTNKEFGIVRTVDLDRIKVARTNLISQKTGFEQAVAIQKNLLKMNMGYDMDSDINVPSLDIKAIESIGYLDQNDAFQPLDLSPIKLMDQKLKMTELQVKAAKYELIPTLTLVGNYNYYLMAEDFYTGPSFHKYPMSMLSLSLKVPIFGGFSKDAKIKKANIELKKANSDRVQLDQSLRMAHSNSIMQLRSNWGTLSAQKENMSLAEDVYSITESNFNLGISSLSDVLNASSELIQAQISYVESLHNYMLSYMELKKNEGKIREIIK